MLLAAPQLACDIDTSNISVKSITNMPSEATINVIYDSNASSTMDRTFKGLLLSMLKDLIHGRVISSGYPCVTTIIKDKYIDDIVFAQRLRFKFDELNDFRLALKIVSWNKISLFSAEEVRLCNKLRNYGNKFVHNAGLPPGYVEDVLMSTKELLNILKTDINVDFKKYNLMLEKIQLMV